MISFNSAKHNKLLRQTYLDSLDLGDYSIYVSNLKYEVVDKSGKTRETIAMQASTTSGELTCQGITKIPSNITVYPTAFTWFVGSTEENFLSTIEHELRHAQQTYETPEDYFPQLSELLSEDLTDLEKEVYTNRIVCLSEIDAYRFQLHRIFSRHRNVTKDMQNCLIEDLTDYCKALK
jgi:hypothetical protein